MGNEPQFKFSDRQLDHFQEVIKCLKKRTEGCTDASLEMEAGDRVKAENDHFC